MDTQELTSGLNKPVSAVELKALCRLQRGVKFRDALTLVRSRILWGFVYQNCWYVSPELDLKAAIEANKKLIEHERRLFEEGKTY